MKKIYLTVLITIISVLVEAQSIQDKAIEVGNEKFANSMLRNILIIVGIAIVYSFIKSKSKNNDKNNK